MEHLTPARTSKATATAADLNARLSKKTRAVSVEQPLVDRQLSFDFDAFEAIALDEVASDDEACIEAVLVAYPALLPEGEQRGIAREHLELGRFLRSAGVPDSELSVTLRDAGADSGAVLDQMRQVEVVLPGADILADDENAEDPIDEIDVDLDDDADAAFGGADSDPEETEGPTDDDGTPLFIKAGEECADSALSALLRRIRGPRYAPLTLEQENALAARIQAGEQAAMNELADHNMRFLVFMAKRFRYTGRPLDELIAAGSIGLLVAARKFDPTRGRFTTCAMQWIRQSIQRNLQGDSLMKTPGYMPTLERKIRKEAEGTTDEAERAKLLQKADALKLEIKARRATYVSLDAGSEDDSDSSSLHNLFGATEGGIEDTLESGRLIAWLGKAANCELKTMAGKPDLRARDVFLMRLGLHPDYAGEPRTLGEVATDVGVSRERVRQIFVDAAIEVANAVEHYARGAQNLPDGFREGLLSLGRRAGAVEAEASRDVSASAIDAIFALELAGPDESKQRARLVTWLVQAANRELKTDAGVTDTLSRDVFLMRIGLHQSAYGSPQTVTQISRQFGIKHSEVRELYDSAAEEIAYAVEHYAKGANNLPPGFRKSLLSPSR